jgi:hypothetical protein
MIKLCGLINDDKNCTKQPYPNTLGYQMETILMAIYFKLYQMETFSPTQYLNHKV